LLHCAPNSLKGKIHANNPEITEIKKTELNDNIAYVVVEM